MNDMELTSDQKQDLNARALKLSKELQVALVTLNRARIEGDFAKVLAVLDEFEVVEGDEAAA